MTSLSTASDQEKLSLQGRIRRKTLIKAYHLYSYRFLPKVRLWGGFANLSAHDVFFHFDDARRAAETQRAQGANFRIEEIPAIWLEGLTHGVIISELFAKKPCCSMVDAKIKISQPSIGKLMSQRDKLENKKWILWSAVKMGAGTIVSDRQYKIYKSHITGKPFPIQWSISTLDIDDSYVRALMR